MKHKHLYILALLFASLQTFAQSTTQYQYDELNRLISVTYANGTTVSYTYDAVGNRLTKTVNSTIQIPTVTTAAVSNIESTSATCGGNVTSAGASTVTARGVCWSTSPSPTVSGNHTSNGSGTGSFTSSITGLSPNTTYYVRAYATNSAGTAYGSQRSFTTPCSSVPNVTISGNTSITIGESTTLTASGASSYSWSNGSSGSSITVSPSSTTTYTVTGTNSYGCTATASATVTVTGGSTGSCSSCPDFDEYWYIPLYSWDYKTASIGPGDCHIYQIPINTLYTYTFQTCCEGSADFDTELYLYDPDCNVAAYNNDANGSAQSSIVYTNTGSNRRFLLKVTGHNAASGSYTIAVKKECIAPTVTITGNTTITPGQSITLTASGASTYSWDNGSTSSSITVSPTSTTTYTVTGSLGNCGSSTASVTVTMSASMPTVTTANVSNIGTNSATCGGNVTNDGGATVTARGVCWSTSQNPTIADSHTSDGTGTGSFASTITGLTPNTTYYVRAYATNSEGTVYGTQRTFNTECNTVNVNISGSTTITYGQSTTLTASGASSYLWSNGNSGSSITVSPTSTTTYTVTGTNSYGCTGTASVTVSVGTNLPTVTTANVSNIGTNSATCGGNTTDDGGATVTARGVCWSTSQNPTIADSHTSDGTGTGAFTSTLTGLTPNTTYYVRAYATNNAGTVYGTQKTFTTECNTVNVTISGNTTITYGQNATLTASGANNYSWNNGSSGNIITVSPSITTTYTVTGSNNYGCTGTASITVSVGNNLPTVITSTVSNVETTSATCGGNVSSDGGATITARGVCWSTLTHPTITDSHTSDGSGTGAFTSTMTGLTPSTTYYVRAYATNIAGTAYGTEMMFTTAMIEVDTTCSITFEMHDSYGDGWNGNKIIVHNHGTTQEVSLNNGSDGTTTMTVYDGPIELEWVDGNWAHECSFNIYGPSCFFYSGEAPTTGVFLSSVIDCGNNVAAALPSFSYIKENTGHSTIIHFQNNSTNADNFTWDFGDGTTSTESSPVHEYYYQDGCNFNVTLSANNHSCQSYNTITDELVFNEGYPSFTYSTENNCDNVIVHFEGSSPGQSFSWDFGDGTTSNESSPIHEYTSSDNYTVYLWNNCSTYSATLNVTLPKLSTIFDTVVCATNLPITWHGHTFTNTEIYTENYTTANNCDSTITLSLTAGMMTEFFGDDFNDGVIDPTKWSYTGNAVLEEDGILKLQQNVINQDVHLRSVNLNVPANGKVSIDRKFMLHRSNNYDNYYAGTFFYLNGNTNNYFKIDYYNSSFEQWYGTYLVYMANGNQGRIRLCDATFDTWLNERIDLDFNSGTLSYNRDTMRVFTSIPGLASQQVDSFCVQYNPYGTWIGHQHYIDYVNIYGTPRLVTTSPISSITSTGAICGGNIPANDCILFTERGVCWSTSQNPTVADAHTNNGPGMGAFTSTITSLTPNTTYYVRAYSTNSMGTFYGEEVVFTTAISATTPIVATSAVTDITTSSAICGGNITNDGGATVTARGVCWSTLAHPTITDSHTSDGSGTGAFTSSLTGLTPNTTYYVRAYATNSAGTDYGEEIVFTTTIPATTPIVVTSTVTDITTSSAICGGNVTNNGGTTVTARGICWSTSQNPTITDSHTTNGGGLGEFTSTLTWLTPSTTYYVRAYATNSAGTGYGEEVTFTTNSTIVDEKSCSGTPTVTDYDGNIYNTVQIGNQCWTRENLRTTHYADGTAIPAGGDDYSYTNSYYYNYSSSNIPLLERGYLYNWPAVMYEAESSNAVPSGVQGICPTGWHVPSDAEWFLLMDYVSSRAEYICGGDASYIAKTLASETGWNNGSGECHPEDQNVYANNATGFSAIPAGECCYGTWFRSAGDYAYFWSTTQTSNNYAYSRYLKGQNAIVFHLNSFKDYGHSVRCLRDSLISSITPTVTTSAVTSITASSATCGGNVTADGGATVTARGICWSTNSNPTVNDNHTSDGAGTGTFTSALTGLTPNTTYYVRAYATNSAGTAYGEEVTFTTNCNPLAINIMSSKLEICNGECVTLYASGSDSCIFHWNTEQVSSTISDCPSTTTTYAVTGVDYYGCEGADTITIIVNDIPATPIVTVDNTTIFEGEQITLSVTNPVPNAIYIWYKNGELIPYATQSNLVEHLSTINGDATIYTYTVVSTLSNNSCFSSISENTEVTVLSTPVANVTVNGSTTVCEGSSVTLHVDATPANLNYSYQWYRDGMPIPGANAADYVVAEPARIIPYNYFVIVSVIGSYNITTFAPAITIVANPLVGITVADGYPTSICDGGSTVLQVNTTSSGELSYQWFKNGYLLAGETNQTLTINNLPYGTNNTYTVEATQIGSGCSAISASKVVSVNPTYNTPLTHRICQGESYNFYGQNITTAGTYTHTLQTVNGCDSVLTLSVTLDALPPTTITGNTTICEGETTTLTANGGVSYVWSDASTSNSITVSQSGIYTVTATNAQGCSAPANVTVTVNPLPNVGISGNNSFCQGDSLTLTASGASAYAWSNASNSAATAISSAGTYTVTGTDANGCTNIATKTVSVNLAYNTTLTHRICQGESYNFYGQNITAAGTYTHTLQTVNGCDSVLTLVVTLEALPPTVITGNTTICQGETTTLTASGGASYLWSDASTSNSISVSQSGIYTVTATNAQGCSAAANITVTVNPLPNVTISGNNSFCQDDSLTLTATGASAYAWSNASNSAATTVSSAGTYTVTGTDANGCTNTATKAVSVSPTYNIPLTHSICQGESYNFYGQNITAAGTYTHTLQTVNGCDSVLTLVVTLEALPPTAITGNTTICQGESTTLTASGGVSYVWSDASTSNSISVSQSGIYTVTATNAQGCSAAANITVTVNPLPNVNISGNTTICAGSSTTLIASGANSYIWSTGDNTAITTVNAFGIYTVTGTSSEGCSNTASATVLVSQLPVITISGGTDLCAGETTTLTANGGDSYLWNDGTTGNSLMVNTAGIYQVIGYNAAGCSSMADVTVNLWQHATSEFTITTPDSCYIWNAIPYCTSGDYTQTLQTVHGCDSTVTLHLTITVGIDDYNLGASMTVYPNPTTGMVNVECTMNNGQMEVVEFQLFDAFGRLLRTTHGVGANNHSPLRTNTHGSSAQTQIDLSHYAAGIYFVKAVADGNVVAVRKVVKR